MFDNKVLVNLYILSLGKNYEIYVPVNEKIGNISKLLNITMFDSINSDKNNTLFNAETGVSYNKNTLVRDSDIRNGTKLILV